MASVNMMKFCPYCGSKIIPNANFCIECGKDLTTLNMNNVTNETENTIKTDENMNIFTPKKSEINDDTTYKTIVQENSKIHDTLQDVKNTSHEQPKNIKKSFSLLNKNPNNKNKKEAAHFDIVRPPSPYNSKQESKKVNEEKPQYPNEKNDSYIMEYNSNGLSCPSCGKNMHLTQTSGFLSKSTYHYCPKCCLKFRESNKYLILEEEPQFTRMSNKLHFKRYDLDTWKKIFQGDYAPDFSAEFNKWKFDTMTSLSCPACNHDFARYKSSGFGSKYYLICSRCALTIEEHKNNLYSLYECIENYSPLWKYETNLLTIEDMKRIITTEESEENRLFREKKVKENELKVQEHQMKIQQEKDDLALFNERLESGNPILPAPSDTTIVLKKNEVPIYKMNNITLSEPRAVRTSRGNYGGYSYRITKGVTIHSGRTSSRSESHDEIKEIDKGELLITNQRVVFLGSNRTTNIDMKKIISITSGPSMIQIQRSNKQKPEYFSNINSTINFQVEGRHYTITIDGELIRRLIIGLI